MVAKFFLDLVSLGVRLLHARRDAGALRRIWGH